MQNVTLFVRDLVIKRERTTLINKVRGIHYKLCDYFDISNDSSDVTWFYGFIVFALSAGLFSLLFFFLTMKLA